LGGILRAAGRPKLGSIINFIGYWMIAIPLYFVFSIPVKWGVIGVWFGLLFGLLFINIATGCKKKINFCNFLCEKKINHISFCVEN
jgi:Na+-driven multidrug efflux pump